MGEGGYGTGGIDPSLMDPKHYRMDYLRRRIRQELYAVQLGLLGGEDHARNKPPAKTTGNEADKRGMYAIAKGADKDAVDKVYFAVRDIIQALENVDAQTVELSQLDKDMREKMKGLEGTIGRRIPPPGTPGAELDEDAPPVRAKKPGKAKGPMKAPPNKTGPKAPPMAPKRPKSTSVPAPRAQPTVFAQPRTNR
jgi:hypothetical protein